MLFIFLVVHISGCRPSHSGFIESEGYNWVEYSSEKGEMGKFVYN